MPARGRPFTNAKLLRERNSVAVYAGAVTTIFSLLNIVVGLVFQSVIAGLLGVGRTADSFQLMWAIVTFGSVIFASLVQVLLVPRIQDPSTRLISCVEFIPLAILGCVLSITQWSIALTMSTGSELRTMLLWSSPSHFLAAAAALPQAIAYLQKRWSLAAFVPVANGAGLLLVTVLFLGGEGSKSSELGVAVAVGYLAQLVCIAVPLLWNRPELMFKLRVPISSVIGLFGFSLLTKFQPVAERLLSSSFEPGSVALLGFGQKIAQGILLVAAFGLSITATGSLSRMLGSRDLKAAAGLFVRTVLTSSALTVVALGIYLPVNRIVVQTLFTHGAFTERDSDWVSAVVVCQYLWILASVLSGVFNSLLYVERAYVKVLVSASLGVAAVVSTTWFLDTSVASQLVVPIASSLGALASMAFSFFLVRRSEIWPFVGPELKSFYPLLKFLFISTFVLAIVSSISALCLWFGFTGWLGQVLNVIPVLSIVIGVRSATVRRQARLCLKGKL